MDLMSQNQETLTFIQSATEFNRAWWQGVWQRVQAFITRQEANLRSLAEVIDQLCFQRAKSLGLQDINIACITGSVDREHDFTARFAPVDAHSAERWRKIYTLAVTGKGFPPVALYKVGSNYFVNDGHHRISVAQYLGWSDIQAYVTELNC